MVLLLNANALHIPIADNSIQMCVTSPPYWNLRDYNVSGQLGLERVPDCLGWATGAPCGSCYVCDMVAVFREVKRILRDDGVLFLNLGDSYAGAGAGGGGNRKGNEHGQHDGITNSIRGKTPAGLKPKDLCMIPARVALALQADGWWLRSGITWVKLNPLPESVTDRPTKSTEMVYVLTKSESYVWDQEAVREPNSPTSGKWGKSVIPKTAQAQGDGRHGKSGFMGGEISQEEITEKYYTNGRNMRDVIILATQPTKEAHFATMPEALVDRCIRAGTSEGGCCPTCGQAWERVISKEWKKDDNGLGVRNDIKDLQIHNRGKTSAFVTGGSNATSTLGFRQSCTCPPQPPIGCLVFDPFTGSGTSGRVATKLNRRFVGTELSLKYLIEIAKKRTSEIQPKIIGLE
jgi:DNA modification methylase